MNINDGRLKGTHIPTVAEIVKEIRNDAATDMCYNHEDLKRLANRLDEALDKFRVCELGVRVCLCGDPNWVGLVVEVSRRIGQPTMYKVEWRDGRGFASRWFSREEIDDFAVALMEV